VGVRYRAFVAAVGAFLAGLLLQIMAFSRVEQGIEDQLSDHDRHTVPGGGSLLGVGTWLLEATAWSLLALLVFVLFRKAVAAVLAVAVAVPYAVFGAVNEIQAVGQDRHTGGLDGWHLFCQEVGGPLIVLGATATLVTFALAHREFSPPSDARPEDLPPRWEPPRPEAGRPGAAAPDGP
jgi:hypothetical protein